MVEKLRKTGLDIIGDTPWGTHLCVFYQSKEDLIDILVPYFKAGLENNEFCMWVTSEPLNPDEAKSSLKQAVKDLDDYIEKGQIEILDYNQWHTKSGKFEADKILQGWVEKEAQALKMGFDGLRVTGNTSWLEKDDWKKFADYEAIVNNVIGKYQMVAICTYSLDKCNACEVIEVVDNHQFALIKKEDKWIVLESSEHKKAGETLRESETRFKALFVSAAEGIAAADLETKQFRYVNPAMCRMFGYTEEELIRLGVADIYPKESLGHVQVEFEAQLRGEKTLANDLPCLRKDGATFYANVNATPIVLDGRKCLVGFFTDTTDRKKAEEALVESKERYAKLVENLPVGVYRNTPGPKGRFIEANEAIVKMFEADSKEEFMKHNVSDLYWDQSNRQQFSEKLLRQGVVKNEVLELKTLNGNQMWCSLNTVAKKDKEDNYYFDGIVENITERKKAEDALKKSEEELRQDKLALERKNLALKEMIEHIERTKNKTQEDIAINVDETLMPIVEKLKVKGVLPKYIKLLKHHLKELSSSFGRKITQKSAKLTSREIEICNMIKGGLASKDISELLNISIQTIEKHRKNIRKKLGLSNKKANLSSYLQHF